MKNSPSLPLAGGGALLIALLTVLAGVVLVVGHRIERQAMLMESDAVPGLINAHTIRSAYSEAFACTLQAFGATTPAARESLLRRVADLDTTARGACDDYRKTIHIDPQQDNANFDVVLAARDEFLRQRGQFIDLVQTERRDEAQRFLLQQLTPAYDALMRACDVLLAYNNRSGIVFANHVVAGVGALRWTVLSVVLLAVAAAIFMATSLVRRQRVERELRDSERKFTTVFKLSPLSMTLTRRRDGRILAANDAFRRDRGLVGDITGKTAVDVGIWPSEAEREAWLERLDREGSVRNVVRETARPDGRKVVALLSIEAITLDDEACLLAVAHDITERVNAEQALARTVAELRAIFDSAAIGIALVAPDGRPVRCNPACERFLGYTNDELCRMTIGMFTHREDGAIDVKEFQRLMAGELDSYQIEKRYVRKDGAIVWGRLTASAVRGPDGKPAYGVGMVEDIVERKRSELALRESEQAREQLREQLIVAQKLEALGQLAGGVAHDFNNMLAAIMLYLDLLRKEPAISPAMKDALGELTAVTKRAAGLTRQLLLFSRREPAQRHGIDLNILAGNLLNMLGRLVGSHIKLRHVPAPLPLWVHADSGMLEQVVMNLVVNARDAMPRGGEIVLGLESVTVDQATAARHPLRRAGPFVRLAVRDTGYGMSAATQARIFEPFFTTKEAGKGTGLGLSTVLGIVQQHSGWIEVESEVDKGSEFAVFLPAHFGEAVASAVGIARPPIVGRGSETVLVAEDDDQLRTVTVRILRQNGYTVLEAPDGQAARRLLDARADAVDLLLTDVVMPGGIFGHELAAHLRAQGRDTRVILMSAHNALVDRAAIESAGDIYLPKPFDTARLLSVVRAALDGVAAPG